MKQFNFLLFLFVLSKLCLAEDYINPPKDPPYTTNICIRLTPNSPSYEILLQKKYFPSYRVDCQIQAGSCDWLVITNGIESTGEVFESFVVSAKESHFNDPDARFVFTTTETGIIENNGEYGEFNPRMNTQFTNIPGDRTVNWIVQWDLAPGNTSNEDDIPIISVGLPDNSVEKYILYGECDDDAISIIDSDYLRFTPTETSGKIYVAFPTPRPQCNIKLSLIQLNANNEYVTLASCTQYASNSSFKPFLTFNNLDVTKTAFIEICFYHNSSQYNVDYKIAVLNCQTVGETINWLSDGVQIVIPQNTGTAYVSFQNLNSIMCMEAHARNEFSIEFYDENFNKINNSLTKLYDDSSELYKIRKQINDLSINENTIAKIVFTQMFEWGCYIKISRIKPIILIHGIDACPRTPRDNTFFGSLKDNNPYWLLRPYGCYDFPWSSMLSIKDKYVGKNILGDFIQSNRGSHDLKTTVVAHSAGCIMTYYECQEHNVSFQKNVDNIVFAGPPLLGSYLADQSILLAPIDYIIKRTSHENMNLIARGTKANWERGNPPFLFDNQRVTVVIGLRKYIYANEVAYSIVDSLNKYKNYSIVPKYQSFLQDRANNAFLHVDIWWDVIADNIEGLSEYMTGLLAKCYVSFHSSELNKRNRSDSAVGTYSAYLNRNSFFYGINSRFTDNIHSGIQRFSSDNVVFFNAVRDRLAISFTGGE